MKSGAIDFLTKPFDRDQLVECMDRMLDSVTPPPANAASTPIFFGKSETLNETLRLLDLVVPLSTTVLLTGDTGTGKDLAARYLHQKGRRPDAPFVSLHCGAVPENLLEDELFGHVKGAFTGADRDRAGCFEMADDGTLFLDEIGTMSLSLQGKLLRVLQDQEVRRLGDSTTRRVTVRVIVATNSDLEEMVLRQQFRADLYYRVASFPIRLPTLAERGMDIVLLARRFMSELGRQGPHIAKVLSPGAIEKLLAHSWPGNVRELRNVVERAVVMSEDRRTLEASDLALEEARRAPLSAVPPVSIPKDGISFERIVSELERQLLLKSLELSGGNKKQAAELLRLKRTTLLQKLKRLNVSA